MAITKVAQFLSSPTTTADYEGQNAHINAFIQQMSNNVLHLTEWTTTTVPQIAQGVYLRHAGVLYIVDTADFTIATGDLSGAGTYYIKLTTSGDSLAVAWEDTLTSYAWSIAYQGYYNGTSQILPYKVYYDTTYTKYRIIDMSASNWSFSGSDGRIDTVLTAAAGTVDTIGTLEDKALYATDATYTLLEHAPFGCVLRLTWNALVDNAAAEATYDVLVDGGSVNTQTTSSTSPVVKTYDVTLTPNQVLAIKLDGDSGSYQSRLNDLTVRISHSATSIEQAFFDVAGMPHS